MISYAQNREDVLLNRVFSEVTTGFYVDVGAHHPTICSITKHFYDKGWRGLNIEPGLKFPAFLRERPLDINLNVAASDRCGTLNFYEHPADPGTSTVCDQLAQGLEHCRASRYERPVEALTLAEIFERHAVPAIDFMSVDVEGHERCVLLGNDWARFRPRALVIEATLPYTNIPCHDRWEDVLTAANYLFAHFDGINRYYVSAEEAALLEKFRQPVNVLDNYELAETRHLLSLLEEVKAGAGHVEAERARLGEEVRQLTGALLQLEELSRQSDLDRARLRGEGRRVNRVIQELEGLTRQAQADRLRLQGEVESLHGALQQLARYARQGDAERARQEAEQGRLRAEHQRLEAELGQLRDSLRHLEGARAQGTHERLRLQAELARVQGEFAGLTRGTGARSFRLGMRVARGLYWLAGFMRLRRSSAGRGPSAG
jgi:FkbM family methyltransferase